MVRRGGGGGGYRMGKGGGDKGEFTYCTITFGGRGVWPIMLLYGAGGGGGGGENGEKVARGTQGS